MRLLSGLRQPLGRSAGLADRLQRSAGDPQASVIAVDSVATRRAARVAGVLQHSSSAACTFKTAGDFIAVMGSSEARRIRRERSATAWERAGMSSERLQEGGQGSQ